jgi:hypothetical protein
VGARSGELSVPAWQAVEGEGALQRMLAGRTILLLNWCHECSGLSCWICGAAVVPSGA